MLSIGVYGFASTPASCPDTGVADPPVPGVLHGKGKKAHVLLGAAPDYPPYTAWSYDTGTAELSGFNVEFGKLMEPICGVKVDYILDAWSSCWTAKPEEIYFDEVTEYVGKGIYNGYVHGCTAYTHTKGERGLSLEFTHSILAKPQTAGILTRLVDGVPVVSPMTYDFSDIKLGDVTGWAPTADTFGFNQNKCVQDHPYFVPPTGGLLTPGADGNAPAVAGLLDGTYDALYLYASQMAELMASEGPADNAVAEGFGTAFAYIQTGLDQWMINGTTLAMSKRGSGLASVLNPCIDVVVRTQEYLDLCKAYFEESQCIGGSSGGTLFYNTAADERTDSYTCASGYCTCSE